MTVPALEPGAARADTVALSQSAATVGTMLNALSVYLAGDAGLPARQEARDLIAAVLDQPRFWPSAHGGVDLTTEQRELISAAAARLRVGMPFAYAVQRAAFRSLTLHVDARVLIPRPETELLVDIVLDATNRGSGTVVDVGTGSGCLAIALAVEGTFARVIATDVSDDALAVAQGNAARYAAAYAEHGTVLEFRSGAFLAPCAGDQPDVIVANPPYIAWSESAGLPALVRDWEPPVALFADDDGMAAIDAIVAQSASVLRVGGLLALEVDSQRAERAAELVVARRAFRDVAVKPDLSGRARFVLARRVEE